MRRGLMVVWFVTCIVLLTIVTQIGGIVLLVWISMRLVTPKWVNHWKAVPSFLLLYCIFSVVIVPPLAKLNGRVPLPVLSNEGLKPANLLYPLFNRHYVKRELKVLLEDISASMNSGNQSCDIIYLDACFPFFDGFPLLPHLSHNDGKKVDLAFIYLDPDGEQTKQTPTYSGYGFFEVPLKQEVNTMNRCRNNRWYQLPKWFTFGERNGSFQLCERQTAQLLQFLNKASIVEKIFIEPHLKQRWQLHDAPKVRFQGCHSVRHDDHIHFQIF